MPTKNIHCVLLAAPFLLLPASDLMAGPKEDCEEIVSTLGLPINDYSFEDGGLFKMDRHNFGAVTCFVTIMGNFDSLYRGDTPLAEDGYFGPDSRNATKQTTKLTKG